MGGRPANQQGLPYANLLAMPQYSQARNPQPDASGSAAPEGEQKPNPEALLAYLRQNSAALGTATRPVSHNPSQQMYGSFQGQQQVTFSGSLPHGACSCGLTRSHGAQPLAALFVRDDKAIRKKQSGTSSKKME